MCRGKPEAQSETKTSSETLSNLGVAVTSFSAAVLPHPPQKQSAKDVFIVALRLAVWRLENEISMLVSQHVGGSSARQ